MSALLDFYNNNASITLTNNLELTFDELMKSDDELWDGCHSFIQWIFPVVTPSKYNINAPILTYEDSIILDKGRLRKATIRFLRFLYSVDMDVFNHNHLRITRIIECLVLCDEKRLAESFLNAVLYSKPYMTIDIFTYWYKALESKW